jgi:hypothetical protein
MTGPASQNETLDDVAYNYTVVSLFALVVLTSVLLHIGIGIWCLLPAMVGLIAVGTHWRAGPPLVLVSAACLLVIHRAGMDPYRFLLSMMIRGGGRRFGIYQDERAWQDDNVFLDFVLGVAVLAYTVAHYRALSLVNHVFPPDPRQRERPPAEPGSRRRPASRLVEQKRSPATVDARELLTLLAGLPLWAGLAWFLWDRLTEEEGSLVKQASDLWLAVVLIWTAGLVVAGATVLLRYLGQFRTTVEENLLFLQDQVWQQTRREQSRLNRWLVWARRRGQRRKEGK